jgi:hypothetical protein
MRALEWLLRLSALAQAGVFAAEMASGSDAACAWLAAGIGLVWSLRTVAQVAYFSPEHWRGNAGRTFIHVFLFVV